MKDFFVVGFYEDFKLDALPSHVSPIIAECQNGLYRRWAYRIEKPYKITPTHAVGEFYSTPRAMFAYITYTLSQPTPLKQNSQVVAISRNKILIEHNKLRLGLKITAEALKHINDMGFLCRSFLSLKNALT